MRNKVIMYARPFTELNMEGAVQAARDLRENAESCLFPEELEPDGEFELSIETKDTTLNFAPSAFEFFVPMVEECVAKDEPTILLFLYFVVSNG